MIDLANISKVYAMGDERLWVLRDIDLRVERGEYVAIVGASGSGKSTLMNIVGFLAQPSGGAYHFNGQDVMKLDDEELARLRNRSVGFVFQQFHLLPRNDALGNVVLPVHYLGKTSDSARFEARAIQLLTSFGLGDRLHHRPNELSGGQRQKVAIARALLLKPDLILADEPTGNLDSRSAEDILSEFSKLHRDGHTIILVTHDSKVAAHAHRQIVLSDGQIISDQRIIVASPAVPSPTSAAISPPSLGVQSENSLESPVVQTIRRLWKAYIRDGFENIMRNRGRSLLTMLGVIIGVAAVIAMLTVGNFAKTRIMSSFQSFGANLIWVFSSSVPKRLQRINAETSLQRKEQFVGFDYERDVLGLQNTFPSIDRISPELNAWNSLVIRKDRPRDSTMVKGVNDQYLEIRGYRLDAGRNFFTSDIRQKNNVALIGKRVAAELFPGENPLGQEVRIQRQQKNGAVIRLQVIGVLSEIDAEEFRDPNDVILLPFTVVQNKFSPQAWQRKISSFILTATHFSVVADLTGRIKAHYAARYSGDVKFEVFAKERYLKEIRKILGIFQGLLGGIAALSLLVGGVGIMNMMLVTVTERTREIGLRKALGANALHVERLFLIESILLCVSGGILGIGVGLILSNLIIGGISLAYKTLKFQVTLNLAAVILAFLFSIVVGIIFGVYPARRASKLDPVDALRWE